MAVAVIATQATSAEGLTWFLGWNTAKKSHSRTRGWSSANTYLTVAATISLLALLKTIMILPDFVVVVFGQIQYPSSILTRWLPPIRIEAAGASRLVISRVSRSPPGLALLCCHPSQISQWPPGIVKKSHESSTILPSFWYNIWQNGESSQSLKIIG